MGCWTAFGVGTRRTTAVAGGRRRGSASPACTCSRCKCSPALPAIRPNVVLNEPGEVGWEGRIELSAVNVFGQVLHHPQAPVGGVAPGSIGVVELVAVKYPGPVEEVVDEGVDRNHVAPDLPETHPVIGAVRKRHDSAMWASFGPTFAMVVTFPMSVLEEVGDRPTGGLALSKVLVTYA